MFAFSHSETAISFNILLVLQISKCTDKTPKSIMKEGGGGARIRYAYFSAYNVTEYD